MKKNRVDYDKLDIRFEGIKDVVNPLHLHETNDDSCITYPAFTQDIVRYFSR